MDAKQLIKKIKARGGEIMAPTNAYEVIRARTLYGVAVMYENKRRQRTSNDAMSKCIHHINNLKGTIAPVKVNGRGKRTMANIQSMLERDGPECFFCGKPLPPLNEDCEQGMEITVEHLVAIAHGGPNHISNMFLAHQQCNAAAGHMSAVEKIRMRDAARAT